MSATRFAAFALAALAVVPAFAETARQPRIVVTPIAVADLDPADDLAAEAKNMSVEPEGFTFGETFAEPKACNTGAATFTWVLNDRCSDGLGLYVRFFDVTNDLVWPNSSEAYVVRSGQRGTWKLSVKRGAKVCFGAEPNPRDGSYWGLSLDGDQSCSNCCKTVPQKGNVSYALNLLCD